MSLQVRYCEPCGRAWPASEGVSCPRCRQERGCRDAATLINNLNRALATALANEPTKPHDEREKK